MEIRYITLQETDSTNRYLMDAAKGGGLDSEDIVVAVADYQTAGKGCGTNTWESERGKNLLFSILVHPTAIPVRFQYLLSMAEALAIRDAVAEAAGNSNDVSIKWPNDIYYKDKKISGTLINLNVGGRGIKDLVIGTGINVNQRVFLSDAPNPVSLYNIIGKDYPKDVLLRGIMSRFVECYALLLNGGKEEIVRRYHEHLYRRNGYHRYQDAGGEFEAEIQEVQPDGILVLRRSDGGVSRYEFKEVKFII